MTLRRTFTALLLCAALSTTTLASPPGGKGGGKGGGNEDPPVEPFSPAIAYLEDGRRNKDLRLANRAGDQACLVLRTAQGNNELRGFVYHAGTKVLAYSQDNLGIYLASWADDPCVVGEGTLIRAGSNPEFMDFSPNGSLLAWAESDPGYTGFGSAHIIYIYDVASGTLFNLDLTQWGGAKPEWGVDGEWAAPVVHFSPDFASTNEIIFRGAPLDGSKGSYDSIYGYNINELSAPRKIYDGAGDGIDIVMSVTNPGEAGDARIAIRKGPIRQIAISDGSEGPTFEGYEPAYSCDNTELIHRYSSGGGKYEIQITSADGASTTLWSKANLRFFDWFCP